jgi:glucose-1-phosphate cytidylyltransferase
VKAVILAGGLGTRLREETEFKPKPMVEIGGRPILWHIMKNLSMQGINEFVILAGYKSEVIKNYFLNYRALNSDFTVTLGDSSELEIHGSHMESHWRVSIVDTGALTNTGGRILRGRNHYRDGTFLVTYGDGLADLQLDALRESHSKTGNLVTLTATRPKSRFGTLVTKDSQVERFIEKPEDGPLVNIGFFLMEQAVFDYLDSNAILEQEPLEKLARDGRLGFKEHFGFFSPMDTIREAHFLNQLWDSGQAPWRTW